MKLIIVLRTASRRTEISAAIKFQPNNRTDRRSMTPSENACRQKLDNGGNLEKSDNALVAYQPISCERPRCNELLLELLHTIEDSGEQTCSARGPAGTQERGGENETAAEEEEGETGRRWPNLNCMNECTLAYIAYQKQRCCPTASLCLCQLARNDRSARVRGRAEGF